MFCSPLGWFECQNLPASYYEVAAPLVQRWKEYREEIFSGTIFPIGTAPDGIAWTGMVSIGIDHGLMHALVFRELNPAESWRVDLPIEALDGEVEVLAGNGSAEFAGGMLRITIAGKLGYLWMRISLCRT